MTPLQRSMDLLRDRGYQVAKVEYYNAAMKRRQDLFGVWDLLAVRPGETLAVQVTTTEHLSHRERKIAETTTVPMCREAGWSLHLHGWHKENNRWVCIEVDIS